MADTSKFKKVSDEDLEKVNGGVVIDFKELGLAYALVKGKVPETVTLTPEMINEQWGNDSAQQGVGSYLKMIPMVAGINPGFVKKYVKEIFKEYDKSNLEMPTELCNLLSPYYENDM